MNQPPTWAGRPAPTSGPAPAPTSGPAPTPTPTPKDRRPMAPIVGGIGLVLLVGVGGYILGQRDDATDVEAVSPTTSELAITTTTEQTTRLETTVDDSAIETTTTDDTTTDDTATDTTTDDSATDEPEPAEEAAPAAVDGDRRAVLSGGVLYLRGPIQSEEIAAAIVERASAVVGPENVVNEYVIDPNEPFPESAPLYVEDLVLFAYGSDQINPAFIPLLDLGTLLMSQNPQVIVTVVSHTDSDGSAEFNLALSQRRGEAVKKYWTDLGINPDQIRIDARGESTPIADNDTPDGAQLNRRAEFIITNLLG